MKNYDRIENKFKIKERMREMEKKIRTRIAPSPTGDPHVGTAYIALFNLAFANHNGGDFILRIEDTDQNRYTDGSEQMIFDALHWLGLDYVEGPDVGGDYGSYRQSERFDLYVQYAKELVEKGGAYYCRSEEHTSELQSRQYLVCRLLLEKKKQHILDKLL